MDFDADQMRLVEAARQRSANSGWINVKQAAKMLGVSVRTIRRREASGSMPERSQFGQRLCYRIEDLRNLLGKEF